MFAKRLISQIVQSSGGNVSLELLIPVIRVECQKPLAKLCQFPWRQIRDRLFKFLKCYIQLLSHICYSRECNPNMLPSVSTAKAMNPYSPIDSLARWMRPPAFSTREASVAQSLQLK